MTTQTHRERMADLISYAAGTVPGFADVNRDRDATINKWAAVIPALVTFEFGAHTIKRLAENGTPVTPAAIAAEYNAVAEYQATPRDQPIPMPEWFKKKARQHGLME